MPPRCSRTTRLLSGCARRTRSSLVANRRPRARSRSCTRKTVGSSARCSSVTATCRRRRPASPSWKSSCRRRPSRSTSLPRNCSSWRRKTRRGVTTCSALIAKRSTGRRTIGPRRRASSCRMSPRTRASMGWRTRIARSRPRISSGLPRQSLWRCTSRHRHRRLAAACTAAVSCSSNCPDRLQAAAFPSSRRVERKWRRPWTAPRSTSVSPASTWITSSGALRRRYKTRSS
mmetsp:Transcript_42453/g.123383  ORF Transcript_42453/g.123383 Transcript_42453/m.123383 type:complete len:231 (-) Transcript_42453:10-702(-)